MKSTFNKNLFKRSLLAATAAMLLAGCGSDDDADIPLPPPPPANTAPSITSTGVTASTEGAVYTYTLAATDADGDTLTLTALTIPAWLSFDAASGALSGTPAAADVGQHAVTLSVSDGTDSVSQSFTIVVDAAVVPNTAPSITSSEVTTATEGTAYTYTLTATDADGDTLSLSATTLPSWLSFDAATGVLSGTPATADVGANPVILSVTDGTEAVTQEFTITVDAVAVVNTPPVITSTGVTTGSVGASYTYTLEATDVDGDTIDLSAVTVPPWATFDITTGILSGTPDVAGDYTVELMASDGIDDETQTFTIVVAEASSITVELLVFENAAQEGWVAWTDNGGPTELFTDDAEHDLTTRFTLTKASVAGFSARPSENVNGVPFDASGIVSNGMLTFELKMLEAPTAGVVDWKLKIEGSASNVEVNLSTAIQGHATPVKDVWQTYSFPLANLDVAGGLDFSDITLFMVFPNYNDATGADYLIDNFKIVTGADLGGGDNGGGDTTGITIEDFESAIDSYTFNNFDGGVSTVLANPDASGINTSAQVVKMEKFAGQPWGGSTLLDVTPFALPANSNFTLKVWSTRAVDVLFKLEGGPVGERTQTHSGSGWEELSFDFAGVEGTGINGITLIFDNGTPGDAAADPDNWTFYYDDMLLAEGTPGDTGGEVVTTTVDDFENAIDSYTFNNFEGGVSTVVANPDATGINTSTQVVKMEKFAGAPYGGSTLLDVTPFALPTDSSFTVKVWATRAVDVLFKLEGGPVGERTATHGGTGWEELSFDFTGVEGNGINGITFIFDNGTVGDAALAAADWTFYYDDIVLVAGGGGSSGPAVGIADTASFGEVTNGGFETGNLDGWLAGSGAAAELDDLGSYLVKIVATEAQNQNIYQDRIGEGLYTAGQALTVSFDMRGTAINGGVVSALLYTDDPTQVSKTEELLPLALNENWTPYTFTVIAGDPIGWGVSIRLASVCGAVGGCAVTAYFDNISVSVTPQRLDGASTYQISNMDLERVNNVGC